MGYLIYQKFHPPPKSLSITLCSHITGTYSILFAKNKKSPDVTVIWQLLRKEKKQPEKETGEKRGAARTEAGEE